MASHAVSEQSANVIENSKEIHNTVQGSDFPRKYNDELNEFYASQRGTVKKPWTQERISEVIMHLKTARVSMETGVRRIPAQYYWSSKCDVINVGTEDYLIFKKKSAEDTTIHIVPTEKYFDLLMDIHTKSGHGGRDKMLNSIKNKLYIPRRAIEIFVNLCPICEEKKSLPKKSIVTKPIVSKKFMARGHFDFIDLQYAPDGQYRWLLIYQDIATKFIQLRPLETKQPSEVALQLIDIFSIFGTPTVLLNDDLEWTAEIITEIVKVWPEYGKVSGSPWQAQRQSVDSCNRDVENMLRNWMRETFSTNWSFGCKLAQYKKNVCYQKIIGRSSYSALFGGDPKSHQPESDIEFVEASESKLANAGTKSILNLCSVFLRQLSFG